jgi:hypothetical protein
VTAYVSPLDSRLPGKWGNFGPRKALKTGTAALHAR